MTTCATYPVNEYEYFYIVTPGRLRMKQSGMYYLFMDGMIPGQSEYAGPYFLTMGEEYSALWARRA